MKIRYTPASVKDVQEIKGYIEEILYNHIASNRIISEIFKTCNLLKKNPYLGKSLRYKIGVDTDKRYVLSGKYIIIYKIENEYVSIIRILDTRTNYLNVINWSST